ncbi:hypothetical protein Tco_0919846, partial [Tanacetum coccineum]
SNDLSKSENPASLNDNKFNFVWRSNAVCLQLFTKELEASPGQSAASSIISWHLNDPGSSTDNGQYYHFEKYHGDCKKFACLREEHIFAENMKLAHGMSRMHLLILLMLLTMGILSFKDMEKSGCKEIDLTSLADTFNLQAEHKVWQQREEYIGNGEKAADVNRDEDGSCLAGGAIRMDSEPSGQVKLNMAGQIKQMVSKNRCDMDAGHCPLQFSLKHRGPVNQMRPKKLAVNMMAALSPAFFEHGGPIKQLVLKTRCDMDGGIVPLRSVEHGGPIKRLVLKTRCDMDGGIVPLRSVEHGGPIKQLVLKLAVIWMAALSPCVQLNMAGLLSRWF